MRSGPYRFLSFSSDGEEPVQVHVKRDRQVAKFSLNPVLLTKNRGFSKHELDRIAGHVVQHQEALLEAWNDYFDS
jgi:hypothetical protein